MDFVLSMTNRADFERYHQQEYDYNWEFLFFGANIDAIEADQKIAKCRQEFMEVGSTQWIG